MYPVSDPSKMSRSISNATKATEQDINRTSSISIRYVQTNKHLCILIVVEFMSNGLLVKFRCRSFSTKNRRCRGKSRRGFSIPCLDSKAARGRSMQATQNTWVSTVTLSFYSTFILIGFRLFSPTKSVTQFRRRGIPLPLQGT